MALLAFEGFDNYGSDPADLLNRRGGGLQWNAQSAATTSWVTPGRNGVGSAYAAGQNGSFFGALTAAISTTYIGFAARLLTNVLPGNPSVQLMDLHGVGGAIIQLTLVFNTDAGSIDVYRGPNRWNLSTAVLIGSSINNAFTVNVWNYIELSATISATAGAVEIRNNGVVVCNLSGLNTLGSPARPWFDGVWFIGASAPTGTSFQIDDFYVCDGTTGAGPYAFNSFVGDVRVVTLNTIGNGSTIQWTPLTSSNWVEVSEVHDDGDTSYNSTATATNKDLFHFAALGATISQVLAIQVVGAYRKDDAGTRTINQHLISGGTDALGATYSIPNAYVYCYDMWAFDPDTAGGWSIGGVNALQAGYELTL